MRRPQRSVLSPFYLFFFIAFFSFSFGLIFCTNENSADQQGRHVRLCRKTIDSNILSILHVAYKFTCIFVFLQTNFSSSICKCLAETIRAYHKSLWQQSIPKNLQGCTSILLTFLKLNHKTSPLRYQAR